MVLRTVVAGVHERGLPEDRRRLWSRLVIAGVLLVSLVAPFVLSRENVALVTAGMLGAALAVLLLLRPGLGLPLLLITSMFLPSPNLPGGLNPAVLLLMLLLVLWLIESLFSPRMRLRLQSRTVRPLLALMGVAVLAFAAGQLPWFCNYQSAPIETQLGGLAIFILAPGALLLASVRLQDPRQLQVLTWLFVLLGALHIAGWLLPGRLGATLGLLHQNGVRNNSMFWVWLVAFTTSQAVINHSLHPLWRILLGALALATLFVAVGMNSGWKSGYLPALVVVAAILAARSWRLGLLLATVGAIPTLYIMAQAIATDQYSFSTRLDAWLVVLNMVKASPVIGFGPANYYFFARLFPLRGYAIRFNSHNQYVDIIAQTGVLGLFCYLWIGWEFWRLGWRLRNETPHGGFAQAYVYGAIGGLAGMLAAGMLVDWVIPFVYNIGFIGFRMSVFAWVFLGGLVATEQRLRADGPSPLIKEDTCMTNSSA